MKTVLCVVGARPQFIKHAPVLKAFKKNFRALTAHTCQHYDHNMSRIFFDELGIPEPEYVLEDTVRHAGHGGQTAFMLSELEKLYLEVRPDAILVYGDTNSTLAGALAASKLHIPILHVEAGLRSFNKEMPEEINRILTDHISTLLFAPTGAAVDHLKSEGIVDGVHLVGDVMIDAVAQASPVLKRIRQDRYLFATLHRPYNVDSPERLRLILTSLENASLPTVLPLHPRTRGTMEKHQICPEDFRNIEFIEPIGYLQSLAYQKYSDCVITDSGGIQKEAYALGTRCLTVRYETEWMETLVGGCNTLVGDRVSELPRLLADSPKLSFGNPYGSGDSAERMAAIAAALLEG